MFPWASRRTVESPVLGNLDARADADSERVDHALQLVSGGAGGPEAGAVDGDALAFGGEAAAGLLVFAGGAGRGWWILRMPRGRLSVRG